MTLSNKLVGFFKTDFPVGGVELKLEESLLVHAIAGALVATNAFDVDLPGSYNPAALSDSGAGVVARFTGCSPLKQGGQEKIVRHDQTAARLTASPS